MEPNLDEDLLAHAALIVVDFQEDFCPPNGSLAVEGGRDIASAVNALLDLPFKIKIATQDWHPSNHISFASNHEPPNNTPFQSTIAVTNPQNADECQMVRLWPDHCIQDSHGASLVPELHASSLNHVVRKGMDSRIEMFSAFGDSYKKPCVGQSNLLGLLRDAGTSHVFVVGLAADYCVKETALHAAEHGFQSSIIGECTRAVDGSEAGMNALRENLRIGGVRWASLEDLRRRSVKAEEETR